jgi:hypothetical protein
VWSRVVGSCAAVDVWAMSCVLVYVEVESKMWVAVWWFFIVPVSDLCVSLSGGMEGLTGCRLYCLGRISLWWMR